MVRRRGFIKASGVVATGLIGVTSTASGADEDVDSTTPPADYDPAQSKVEPHTEGITDAAPQDTARVLIIKDRNPWDAPAHEAILEEMGFTFQVINSGSLDSHDLSPYELVIVPGDQLTETYSNLASNKAKLRDYAESGTLFASATTMGWGEGEWSPYLPGSIEYVQESQDNLTIVNDDARPFANLSDTDVDDWEASAHGTFPLIPNNANVGVKAANGDPTHLSYQSGTGTVLAHTMTLEYAYGKGIAAGTEILQKTLQALLNGGLGGGTIPAQDGLAVDGGNNRVFTIGDGSIHVVDLDSWEVAQSYPAPSGTNRGLAYGDGSLWYADGATDAYDGAVLELNPDTGTVRSEITSGWDPYGLAYGDGSLWVADVTAVPNSIHEFAPDGTELQEIFLDEPAASVGPNGLARYQNSFWVGTKDGLYRYDLSGALKEVIAERDSGYNALAGSAGTLYGPDQDGYLTVLRGGGPGPLPGFDNAPTDPDNDGVYEDINGDGTVDISDVQAYFQNLESETVNNNPSAFDFNGDGTTDIVDVQQFLDEV